MWQFFWGVAGTVFSAIFLRLLWWIKDCWKKHRRIESDVVVVGQSISLDDSGRYCVNLVLRNDGEASAVVTGAKLVCEFKHRLELPIQAISKVVTTGTYDCEINPDDGNDFYPIELCHQIPKKEVDSFSIRIDSSCNNWICIFRIVLLVNEGGKELPSGPVGVYFEDVFDGWGLDHATAYDVKTKLNECLTRTGSVDSLLARIDDPSNQSFPGWVIYIPHVTLNAFQRSGGSLQDLIRTFMREQSESCVLLRVEGREKPIEIAKCSFIKPNLVETVGHVVHNRRTGDRIKPSDLYVLVRSGDEPGKLIQAASYWLVPEPENDQPIEGFAYIELVDSAKNVEIPKRAFGVPDFKSYGKQYS